MATTKRVKDPSRAERKLKKRKIEEAIPDLPGDVGATHLPNALHLAMEGREISTKKRKVVNDSNNDKNFLQDGEYGAQRRKKGKEKENRALNESGANIDETVKSDGKPSDSEHINGLRLGKLESHHGSLKSEMENLGDSALPIDEDAPARKSKKERKARRKAAEATQVTASESVPPLIEDAPAAVGGEAPSEKSKKNNRNREKKRKGSNMNEVSEKAEGKAPRFIVFIGKSNGRLCTCLQLIDSGNLPFSATTESIQEHFASVHPKSIRHLTEKHDPEKSKGCAFLEFEGYDHMKACLKSFHHTIFDNGISPPRKINVELT